MKVVVVGAGAAGLAATHALRKRGIHVTLLEASDRAGGRMAGEVVDGFHIDTGAQLFCTTDRVALGLCAELGVPFDRSPEHVMSGIYNKRQDKLGVLDPSSAINLTNLKTVLSFCLFSPKGHLQRLKLGRMLGKRCADFRSGHHLRLLDLDIAGSFADFIRTKVGTEFLQEFCEFSVAGFTLSHPERISPLHGMMLSWVMWFERRPNICMPEQGIGSFARSLAQACADATRLSTPVERVVVEDGAATGVTTREGFIEADAVICATTAPSAVDIVPDFPDPIRTFLAKVQYSSCCHAVFGVDAHPLRDGLYAFMFQRKGDSLLDCYTDSTVGSPLSAPPGKGIMHAYTADEYAGELFVLDDDEIARRVINEIRKYTPAMPGAPIFTRVYRWEHAVCLPHGGMMRELQALRDGGFPGVRGLFLAGEYLHLVSSVNGALTSGIDAAGEVVRFLEGRGAG